MIGLLFLVGSLGSFPPGVIHTPLDRIATASHVFVNCLVDQSSVATAGRAWPRTAVAAARRRCRREVRALDDVYRVWQASQGLSPRGAGPDEIRRLVNQAVARVAALRPT